MRPILIVTPFFAPQSHAAVFRAYKLAKFLPSRGYRPFVVTVDTNYMYREDPSLLEGLPPEVTVVRARYIEPTLRGVETALKLRDRRTIQGPSSVAPGPVLRPAPAGAVRRWATAAHRLFVRGVLPIPDPYWPWLVPALAACRRIVREQGVQLVLTSSDPFTSYLVGLALKADGLTWVADLRDPATHCARMHSEYPWVYAVQRDIERRAVLAADALTVAANSIGLVLGETHGVPLGSKTQFIPTGLDKALLQAPSPPSLLPAGRHILFSGEYLRDYGEDFFRWFSVARHDPRVRDMGYRIALVGRLDINRRLLAPIVAKYQLDEVVDFLDHQPQQVLYGLVRRAEFGLLPYGDRYWWCLAAKLVDYLALEKPVLAVVPNPSEARARLTEAGLGVFMDGDDALATRRLIEALAAGGAALPGNPEVCRRYTVEHQVERFAQLFDRLLAEREKGKGS
jgi:glycosyltransferase involved in cell wall biosynthesis